MLEALGNNRSCLILNCETNRHGRQVSTENILNPIAMASNPIAMASNLSVMAPNLIATGLQPNGNGPPT